MFTTVEALLEPSGTLKFLQPVHLDKPQHVLVTFTDSNDEAVSGLALSEATLATDWLRNEEAEAWAHLQ